MPALKGEKNTGSKLTKRQVLAIIRRMVKGESCAAISKDYPHVHYGTIARIERGETWNSLSGLPLHVPTKKPVGLRGRKNK